MRRLSASCSSTCAVQPAVREMAKIGVNRSVGNAERIINRGGIEIDVGVEVFLSEHDFGDAVAHLNPFGLAQFRAQDLRHPLEMRRARIERFVNAMADAHDLFLLREAFVDVGVHLVERADFLEHLDHAFVRAAMQRAFQRADGAW